MSIAAHRESDQRLGMSGYGREITNNAGLRVERGMVAIRFSPEPSRFVVLISSDSFKDIAQAMMRADRGAAIKAFGAAMQASAAWFNLFS
jgi:hypothetical protein